MYPSQDNSRQNYIVFWKNTTTQVPDFHGDSHFFESVFRLQKSVGKE
jgi:hypothetical protein